MPLHSLTMAEVAGPVSLDSETGSESEDATDSRGSQAEAIADSDFAKTQYADSRDRPDDTIRALIVRLAPCIQEHVEEALRPLVSALRSREENEQKHRQKLLDLEMEKLVLERQRLLFKHRRAVVPFPGVHRNSSKSNRHKGGVKKNPPCAAQQDQVTENGRLREKHKNNGGGGENQTSILLRPPEFDCNMIAREGKKPDFSGSHGKSELQGTKGETEGPAIPSMKRRRGQIPGAVSSSVEDPGAQVLGFGA